MLIVENLRRYLYNLEDRSADARNEPLYLGEIIKGNKYRFAGGGPGYILNAKAIKDLFHRAPDCQRNIVSSAEDRMLGGCMSALGIKPQDTADARGRQRFLGFVVPEQMVRNQTRQFQRGQMAQMKLDHVSISCLAQE